MPRSQRNKFKVKIVSRDHTYGVPYSLIGRTFFVYEDGDARGSVLRGTRYRLIKDAKTDRDMEGWVISSLDTEVVGVILNK